MKTKYYGANPSITVNYSDGEYQRLQAIKSKEGWKPNKAQGTIPGRTKSLTMEALRVIMNSNLPVHILADIFDVSERALTLNTDGVRIANLRSMGLKIYRRGTK